MFADRQDQTGAGCLYLDLNNRGFIRVGAEDRGFVNLRVKLWCLVHILQMNCDLRDRKKKKVKTQRRTSGSDLFF